MELFCLSMDHYVPFQVSMDIDGKNGWKECLSVSGVKLPTGYYFGASAATGQLAGTLHLHLNPSPAEPGHTLSY